MSWELSKICSFFWKSNKMKITAIETIVVNMPMKIAGAASMLGQPGGERSVTSPSLINRRGVMRTSIYVEGVQHSNPIPAASRIDNMVMSSVISGKDSVSGKLPETIEAQCSNMFSRVRAIIEAAGGTPNDIIKMTVWLKDQSRREALNAEWVKMFPDPASVPARHALPHLGEDNSLVLCEFTAILAST
jgi:2-iminobutanoate/2-iminopropanoate deaminase